MPVCKVRIALQQMSAVPQENLAKRCSRRGAINRPIEAVPHQPGQVSRMVEMGVRDDNGVDGARRDGKVRPVSFPEFAFTLEQSTIDKDIRRPEAKQGLGAGNGPVRTEEGQLHRL